MNTELPAASAAFVAAARRRGQFLHPISDRQAPIVEAISALENRDPCLNKTAAATTWMSPRKEERKLRSVPMLEQASALQHLYVVFAPPACVGNALHYLTAQWPKFVRSVAAQIATSSDVEESGQTHRSIANAASRRTGHSAANLDRKQY